MKPKNRIRVILAERTMTNKELAERIEVSPITVSRWSLNKQQPSLVHLYKMSLELEVNLCDFLVLPTFKKNQQSDL